jgi:hypothetical protein
VRPRPQQDPDQHRARGGREPERPRRPDVVQAGFVQRGGGRGACPGVSFVSARWPQAPASSATLTSNPPRRCQRIAEPAVVTGAPRRPGCATGLPR